MDTTTQATTAKIKWQMDSYSADGMPGEAKYEGMVYSAMLPAELATPPAQRHLIAQLEAAGYSYQAGGIKAFMTQAKIDGQPTRISYQIGTAAVFERDGARLAYRISNADSQPTLAEAIAAATVNPAPAAWSLAPAIPTGKGQQKAAEAEARRIRQALAEQLTPESEIVIAITALAGRYGWKIKTAHRRYKVSEIDTPPAKPAARPAIAADAEHWSIFTKQYKPIGRRRIEISSRSPKEPGALGTVEIRRRPFDVTTVSPRNGEAGDWVYIGENYRISVDDWNRLQQRNPAGQAQLERIAA